MKEQYFNSFSDVVSCLAEEVRDICEGEMDCIHDVSRDEDGVNHAVTYILSDDGMWRLCQYIDQWMKEK